jgi:prevent-host-death family protein
MDVLDRFSVHADTGGMKQIAAAKFKERCLALLDSVGPEGLIITKHGKPVAKLIPIRSECAALIGAFKDKIRIKGDLLSTGVRWDADS